MFNWSSHSNRLLELADSIDSPFFYYDLDACLAQNKSLSKTENLKLWYAIKANPLSAVIKTMSAAGFNFDVASTGELNQVLSQGIGPEKILNTGPAKSARHFASFLHYGVRVFILESIQQVADLNHMAAELNIKPQALLRVQLHWQENSTDKNVLGGCQLTPFGLLVSEWENLNLADYKHIDFLGVHIFQWGNILSVNKLLSIWDKALAELLSLAKKLNLPVKVIDLGGGLGIPYNTDDTDLSWSDLTSRLSAITNKMPKTEFWLELGRYVVGPFGCYLTKVIDRKQAGNKELLVLEGGVNHLLRTVLTSQSFPVKLLRNSEASAVEFQLHGPLCTGLDSLNIHFLPNDIQIGDWLIFSQCGAYGFTESMPWFLCHTLPAEVVFKEGQVEIIRNPQPASSWLK